MKHPETCYSQINGNCVILKYGETTIYPTSYPKKEYNDKKIDEMNDYVGITKEERKAIELCVEAMKDNPNLDWDSHYETIMTK